MYLIVGLGNPGARYTYTRHNVGFLAIDILAERHDIVCKKLKHRSLYGEGTIHGEKVVLIKPQTFMNLSGESVRDWMNFYKVDMKHLILIQDDIDIPFSSVRVRSKGSAGTHNGMKSVIYQIQNDAFPRVKIGVGQKNPGQDLADFVLSKFQKSEKQGIEEAILLAADAVEYILKKDVEYAMNQINGKAKAR